MKKIVTVSLNRNAFVFEVDAYNMLDNYLKDIRRRVDLKDGFSEIMSDIESRIADILSGRLTTFNNVVNIEMVKEVMVTIGSPHYFGEVKDDNSYSSSRPIWMRDGDKAVFGGVCAGAASYLHTSIVLVRVLAIVLFFIYGIGLLPYIILWIALPKAKSDEEKEQIRRGYSRDL